MDIEQFEVHFYLKHSVGKKIIHKEIARADSIFFKDFKHFLTGLGKDGPFGWSHLKVRDFSQRESEPDEPTFILNSRFAIPLDIITGFQEVFGCFEHEYYNATVSMSRRLLERILVNKGAHRDQRICDMIKELVNRGILDKQLFNVCDVIKSLGNAGAHDNQEDMGYDDAENIMLFLDFLVTWLYGHVKKARII